jgi:uncharacterized OsmC-like protein
MSLAELITSTKLVISSDPARAQARFEAHHDLVGPAEVSVKVGSGHRFTVDEPQILGGANSAANPVEYALASLGSCQAITYRIWAAQLGIALHKVEVEIDGDIDLRGFFGVDDRIRPGFSAIHIRVHLIGPERAERYEELAAAVDAHCPVLDLFRNQVSVDRKLCVGRRKLRSSFDRSNKPVDPERGTATTTSP